MALANRRGKIVQPFDLLRTQLDTVGCRVLLDTGEDLVRVPPRLMASERRAGRLRGKSDPIDALEVARAALREPRLSWPRPDEQPFRCTRERSPRRLLVVVRWFGAVDRVPVVFRL